MKSLFISTYNPLITIGILEDGKLITKKEHVSEKSHSSYLVPLIETALIETNLQTKDLNEIIVINGPGSFTGVRLGVSVAKTLAYTLNIPIKTITSIEALGSSDNKENKIILVEDAKGAYFGVFKNNILIEELKYLNHDDLDKYLQSVNYLVVKDITLDLEQIYLIIKEKEELHPHSVKTVYIKMIEVEK